MIKLTYPHPCFWVCLNIGHWLAVHCFWFSVGSIKSFLLSLLHFVLNLLDQQFIFMQMGSPDVCDDVGGGVQGNSDAAVTLLTQVECPVTIPKNKENVIKR